MSVQTPALRFLGGTRTVTGSKFLVETAAGDVLVDCGLFQGLKSLRARNWQAPPLDLDRLRAVVLTHAHLDHCGYLPVLARAGWRGPVYASAGTAALAGIVLADSAHLMVEDAEHANAAGWSRHRPALPLYEPADATRAVELLRPIGFGAPQEILPDGQLTLGHAGHILGAAWVRLRAGGRDIVVSGDLGRRDHPVLRPPDPRPNADTLLMESTYGDRGHAAERASQRLATVVNDTVRHGGSVVIPAFAVDRTEVILVELAKLVRAGAIPAVPILVDSPMALASLRVYRRALAERWPELRPELLDATEDPFDAGQVRQLRTVEESMLANHPRMPSIIVSASGMAAGGRVLYHLEQLLPDRRNTVLIVGFAAVGTRARQLVDGATEVKIHGRYVPVRAGVTVLDAFSAHADADELADWATAAPPPDTVYLVHGEQRASAALAERLSGMPGWCAVVPHEDERVLC